MPATPVSGAAVKRFGNRPVFRGSIIISLFGVAMLLADLLAIVLIGLAGAALLAQIFAAAGWTPTVLVIASSIALAIWQGRQFQDQ